jgi:predicted transcriptional regulator
MGTVINFPRVRSGLNAGKKSRNRNRVQIVASLLSAGRQGALKTHLMNRANLSFEMASQYIYNLLRAGLMFEKIDEETTERFYVTSPEGYRFLEVFEDLQTIVGNEEVVSSPLRDPEKQVPESYRVCMKCEPHPSYPGIHPVTRHKGDECVNCHSVAPTPKVASI